MPRVRCGVWASDSKPCIAIHATLTHHGSTCLAVHSLHLGFNLTTSPGDRAIPTFPSPQSPGSQTPDTHRKVVSWLASKLYSGGCSRTRPGDDSLAITITTRTIATITRTDSSHGAPVYDTGVARDDETTNHAHTPPHYFRLPCHTNPHSVVGSLSVRHSYPELYSCSCIPATGHAKHTYIVAFQALCIVVCQDRVMK